MAKNTLGGLVRSWRFVKKSKGQVMRERIYKIIKENFDRNNSSVPWEGMHDNSVDQILKLIKEQEKENESKFINESKRCESNEQRCNVNTGA